MESPAPLNIPTPTPAPDHPLVPLGILWGLTGSGILFSFNDNLIRVAPNVPVCVRAAARPGCLVELDRKKGCLSFSFPPLGAELSLLPFGSDV